ncbi:hypothetical protein L7F22_000939 [Adiantum nelumboides]|nr:hypothetical protein [Adiantum nelumboides]
MHIQLPLMLEMPEFPSTQEEEQQRPAPGALDVKEQLEQEIEDMVEGPAKEYLLYKKKVMESAALAFRQPEEQIKDFGHDFLPLPLMLHKAILWKEKEGKKQIFAQLPCPLSPGTTNSTYVVNTLNQTIQLLRDVPNLTCQMLTIVTDVYMLRCQHPYHPLCSVIACKSAGQCLLHGCEEPLKDALKLLTPGEANMDEHVGTAHSQARSSRKPNIDSMCGGCGDKNASQKQASEDTPDQQKAEKRAKKRADVVEAQGDASKESTEVTLKPQPAMNKDVEDTEKSSEKPIEKDTTVKTTVNLSDEDTDLLISDVCGEILGCRKKRSNTKERAKPKKKAKAASEPPKPTPGELSWIGDVQELDETAEDIAAKQDAEQDADVTTRESRGRPRTNSLPKIEEILPNCPGWQYLVLNFCKIIILNLNGLFVKRDVSKHDPKTGQLEHPSRPASDRVNIKRVK